MSMFLANFRKHAQLARMREYSGVLRAVFSPDCNIILCKTRAVATLVADP